MSTVSITKDRYTVESLYQWDKNQKLTITGLSLASVPEIHFTNTAMDRAIVRPATMDGSGIITADIPNSLLQKPYKITAYVCVNYGETFESLYSIDIPVIGRKKPGDYTLEYDTEVYSFTSLEDLVNNAVQKMESLSAELESIAFIPIETGTVDGWSYRKYSDGTVDVWGKKTLIFDEYNVTNINDEIMTSGLSIPLPFDVGENPCFSVNVGELQCCCASMLGSDSIASVIIFGNETALSQAVTTGLKCDIKITGKWK